MPSTAYKRTAYCNRVLPCADFVWRPARVGKGQLVLAAERLNERYRDLVVAAGSGGVQSGGDAFKMQSNPRPFRGASQNDERDLPAGQILLVPYPLICGEQEIDACFLRSFQ